MKTVSTLLATLILLLLTGPARAGEISARYHELREAEILRFADDLFAAGEHYRAITEAKRYLSLYPAGSQAAAMAGRIGDAFLLSREWDDAIAAYDDLLARHPASPLAARATFHKGIALLLKGNVAEAERLFATVSQDTGFAKRDEALRWRILLRIRQNRLDDAMALLKAQGDGGAEPGAFARLIEQKRLSPYKSPETAGLLSAVLPGSGQAYVGRYRDGLQSFLLNGLFILAAVKAFDQQNHALGALLAIFEVGWYTGGVYGAVGAAHKHNRGVDEEQFRSGVRGLNLGRSEIGRTGGVSILFHYPF